MRDEQKTKAQLIEELHVLRERDRELAEPSGDQPSGDDDEARWSTPRRFEHIFEHLPMACAFVDTLTGQLLQVNHAICELLGYSAEELVTLRVGDITHTRGSSSINEERMADVVAGKVDSYRIDKTYKKKDGDLVPAILYSRIVRAIDGGPLYSVSIIEDISQRIASEQKYRRLFDAGPDSIVLNDPVTGMILDVNKPTESLYGYTRDELLNMRSLDLSAEPEKTLESIARAEEGTLRLVSARHHRKKDGTVFPVEITLSNFIEEGRRVVSGATRDITDRMRSEEALRESGRMQSGLINAVSDALFVIEPDGTYVIVNQELARRLGKTVDELIGCNAYDLLPEEVAMGRRECGVQVCSRGEPLELVDERDGRTLESRVYPIKDDSGEVVQLAVFGRDITEAKRTDKALVKSSLIIESTTDAIITTDVSGDITFWNRGAERLYGYQMEEVIGRSVGILYREKDLTVLDSMMAELMAGNKIPSIEVVLIHKDDREIDVLLSLTTINEEDGRIVELVGITKDITERKQMERELLRMEHLRAVGELSSGVSHNLNNILTGVLGPAEMMHRRTSDPDDLKDLGHIINSGERARDLAHRLYLSVRGIQEDALEAVDVNQVVREAVQATRPRWKDETEARNLWIDVVSDLGDVPGIKGTPSQAHDILINLIFNAVDAMPGGGRITIETSVVEEHVRLRFSDTGEGMDAETLHHIFDPFYTTKLERGTGLGLSTVQNTIIQWEGKIDVKSTPGQGTTFTLLLPMWDQDIVTTTEGRGAHINRTGRLLIVDDDEGVRDVLFRLLSPNHEVEMYSGARAALVDIAPGKYDAALLDLGMEELAGDELAIQLLGVDPSIATVLITGWELRESDPRRTPFDFFLKKPLGDLGEIEDLVARAIALHDERAGGATSP